MEKARTTLRRGRDEDLFFLAYDHRSVLRRMYGDRGHGELAITKEIVLDGLLEAVETDPRLQGSAALLVDEEYGAATIAPAHAAGIVTSLPIERSGADVFTLDFGDSWRRHLDAFPCDYAKVLVFLNPDSSDHAARASYESQLDRLASTLGVALEDGYGTMLELIVPATAGQLDACGGEAQRFDADLRPELVAEVIGDCYERGMRPSLWKLEGLESTGDCEHVAAAVDRHDPEAGILVLGRGADDARVKGWLANGAGVDGYSGFAIGRSIWDRALGGYLQGTLSRERATSDVAARYLDFVSAYRAAAGRET